MLYYRIKEDGYFNVNSQDKQKQAHVPIISQVEVQNGWISI